jgi:hypothetical protein
MSPDDRQPGQSNDPQREPPGRQPGGQHGGGQGGGVQQAPPAGGQQQAPAPGGRVQQPQRISEMDVSTPTLRWVTVSGPMDQVPLGVDDYVIDSVYDPQAAAWSVLVLVQPGEQAEMDEDEAADEADE